MTTPLYDLAQRQLISESAPMVRCADCALDLTPSLTVRAAFRCPLFSKPRASIDDTGRWISTEPRCIAFEPITKGRA